MPQLRLEYSSNINNSVNFNELLRTVHLTLQDSIKAKIEDCKSRIVKLDNFFIGDGNTNNAMVHLEVAILEGRTAELKKELGEKLIAILNEFFSDCGDLKLQITLQIKDIVRSDYFKSVF